MTRLLPGFDTLVFIAAGAVILLLAWDLVRSYLRDRYVVPEDDDEDEEDDDAPDA
jgi:hypothetical protein